MLFQEARLFGANVSITYGPLLFIIVKSMIDGTIPVQIRTNYSG